MISCTSSGLASLEKHAAAIRSVRGVTYQKVRIDRLHYSVDSAARYLAGKSLSSTVCVVYTHTHTTRAVHIYIYTYIHICVYTHVYEYVYVCMYIYIYIYIYVFFSLFRQTGKKSDRQTDTYIDRKIRKIETDRYDRSVDG